MASGPRLYEPSPDRPGSGAAGEPAAGFSTAPAADPSWLLVEEGFTLVREHEIESLFTVANGYIGTRGSLAEGSSLSRPMTFAAGVFDTAPDAGAGPALARLPNWTHLALAVGGLPLALEEGEILEHRRVLDLRQGIVWRDWRQRDPAGRITRLRFLRLASLADRHLALQSVLITPENYSDAVRVESRIEWPAIRGGGSAEPDGAASPPHLEPREEASARDPGGGAASPARARGPRSGTGDPDPADGEPAVLLGTTGRGVTVAVAVAGEMRAGTGERIGQARESGAGGLVERWTWNAGIGETVRLDRLVAVYTSRDGEAPELAAVRCLGRSGRDGVDRLVAAHAEAWRARWATADVRVAGDEAAQRALRFAAYQLVSAANPEDGRVSIGARALTGDAYRGHVFWDTEIYLLPFYTLTDPPAARTLLMYRYHTLPAARAKARALGYRGALYAWESADTGEEATPSAALTPDGEVIRIRTGEEEHHISADVAYGVWQYWHATGDDPFLLDAGAEVLLETARFWASRGRLEADGRYHIRGVIGPDEYHEGVDDSAYTNVMARWNLSCGAEVARLLAERWPERWRQLADRLRLAADEPETWRRLAAVTETGFDPQTGLFEQFEGYFGLEEVDRATLAACTAPIDVCLGRERTRRSKVVKQADVVALGVLLWDAFPREVHAANFRYYEPRTGHGSSLSPAFHALVAARLGDAALAGRYLRQAAEVDLANTMGNAAGGVHIAAQGGLWQAAVLGTAGLRLRDDGLALAPHLPPGWRELSFSVLWRGRTAAVSARREPPGVEVSVGGEGAMTLALVDGPATLARPGRRYVARLDGPTGDAWREEVGP